MKQSKDLVFISYNSVPLGPGDESIPLGKWREKRRKGEKQSGKRQRLTDWRKRERERERERGTGRRGGGGGRERSSWRLDEAKKEDSRRRKKMKIQ